MLPYSLKHGHEARRGSISSDATMETLTLLGAQTVLDCMQIQTTSVQIFRYVGLVVFSFTNCELKVHII